jgi:hypothetical protein
MLAIFIAFICIAAAISGWTIVHRIWTAHERGHVLLFCIGLIVGLFSTAMIGNLAIGGYKAYTYEMSDDEIAQNLASITEKISVREDELLVNFENWMIAHDKEFPDTLTVDAITEAYPELKGKAFFELLEYNNLRSKQTKYIKGIAPRPLTDIIFYWPIIPSNN